MKKSGRVILGIIGAVLLVVLLLSLFGGNLTSTKVSYFEMIDKIQHDSNITKVTVDEYKVVLYSGNTARYYTYYDRDNPDSTNEIKEEILKVNAIRSGQEKAPIKLSFTDPNAGSIWSSILPILGGLLLLLLLFYWMRSAQNGAKNGNSFGKTKARLSQSLRVRFTDVAGAEEEKEELAEVVEFLRSPQKFSNLGARIPKGILLVGPPGTGKTLFAKAVAGEANVPFFSISGSDFVELYVGVGASRVRDLFDMAKKSQPCIIFIDEIDAVGRQRGTGLGGGHDEREQTLNQLLVQMDGFDTNEGIIVMAATNRADILDPALLRPGRFDRQVHVNLPDVRGREAILRVHARNKPLASDVNFKVIARMTSGFAGADLENLLNEAAILAARDNRKFITNADLYEGLDKVLAGPAKKSRLVTESDKRITAYHEAGHAVLAELQPHCNKVHEVTIIPRGGAAGFTMTRPQNDDSHISKSMLMEEIVMALGGRVAEELVIKEVCTGAQQDLKQVTEIARAMVTEFGMSEKVGPISYASGGEVFIGRDMAAKNSYSEETANLIDEEIAKIIKEAHARATELLSQNISKLEVMARCLVERETIYEEEVEMIMQGKSAKEVCEEMDARLNGSTNPFIKVAREMGEEVATPENGANNAPVEGENSAQTENTVESAEASTESPAENTETTAEKPEESEENGKE